MKRKILLIAAIILVIQGSFSIKKSFAQWEPDVRLTNDPDISYPSYNNARNIAASGDTVHVVWYDHRSGYYLVYYKRSTDNGLSWGDDLLLTNIPSGAAALYPSVALSENHVYVVWHSDQAGNGYDVYFKGSADGGETWEPDVRLTNDAAFSGYPSLAASGDTIHVTWYDERDGNAEIYYNRSTNGGLSWGFETRLTNNSGYSWSPSISVSGNQVHIVWFNNISGNEEIFYRRSSDGGVTWENEVQMTNDAVFSDNPSIAVSGNDIHIVWMSNRDGNFEIYHGHSNNGGATWAPAERLTFADGASYNPSVFCSGLDLHCVWYDSRDGNYEIYYKRSTDSGASWEDDFRLTDDPASSAFPFIAGTDSALHVLWQDFRDGNPEIYYKRFLVENPGTGIRSIATNPSKAFSLGQNHPNPCSSLTRIKFQVPDAGNVNITLYDLFGKEAATLFNEKLLPGRYEITFDASGLSHGIWYCCLRTGNSTETKKMIKM